MAHEWHTKCGSATGYSPLGVIVVGQPGGHTISSAFLGAMPF